MRAIKHVFTSLVVVAFVMTMMGFKKQPEQPKVLVFSKTVGFRHASIGAGKLAIIKLGSENGFSVDTTEDAALISEGNLKKYAAVIFLSTTGDVLNEYQQADFERYIQAGGGFIGIHAAADCEYSWPWYGKLVGGYFKSHPKQQTAKIIVKDKSHISTKHLPDVWERWDEWYNYKVPPTSPDYNILLALDEKSYEGGENGDNHPIAWYHKFDGGKAFYTGLGHTDESYKEENFLKHLIGGINWVLADSKPLDFSKATSQRPPDADRFVKTTLAQSSLFFEPTELAILPNLDILIVQRRGEILHYSNATKKLTEAGKLSVYHKATVPGVNAEEGLLGITVDPDFNKNSFVYMYYAPIDTSVNRLSRFVFKNGKVDLNSEKIVLQLYSQRNICCHTGGSLTFGPDRTLFLSTGDNSTPFDQKSPFKLHGFGPLDGREGYENFDARRSSGNTNDLRGKILRIKMNEDGSYDIPEGNLFPKGTEKTKPEIFVMGNRNPYRISVDRKTKFLYWGEVGPDANDDSLATRGSRGYDELNQARKAGYFGWPLFVGKNYPYRRYDFDTGVPGEAFDPLHPINDSKNNTGLRELPAVSPPFIWYPYAVSPDFPELGTGGRNAMAGPIYYPEFYPKETRFPDYYAGKLFFYDWIRGWVKAVSMKPNGDLDKMEPVMQNIKFNSPIDMEMGPDGKIYVLEYGTGWFTKNPDAGLVRVDFNAGNRSPKALITVDKTDGSLPMTVNASAEGTVDPDHDPVTYVWHFGKQVITTKTPKAKYTFTAAGDYNIYVDVKDDKGAIGKSSVIGVYAGNQMPEVKIELPENPAFAQPGVPVKYKVVVKDKEDGASYNPSNIYVKADYISGKDKAQVVGHQVVSTLMEGKAIMENMDCKTCHKINEKSIGPAYNNVSAKYQNNPKATEYLTSKIIKGGSGVWGEVAMSGHPDLKPADAQKIVSWILSLK
ncbi:MAG: ThuA domain-containing protein, partial [Chitinophagaceae bacterium]